MTQRRHYEIVVEGETDQHVLSNLLHHHGIPNHRVKRDEKIGPNSPVDKLLITVAGSRQELLQQIPPRIKAGNRSAIGFVIDADDDALSVKAIERTWTAICAQAKIAGMECPPTMVEQGHVQRDDRFDAVIGYWIMPDNRQSGAIESFLRQLINDNDTLIDYAEVATRTAKDTHHARFSPADFLKAQLACWLAWQEQPGTPLGQAWREQGFQIHGPLATTFVEWIKSLLECAGGHEGD